MRQKPLFSSVLLFATISLSVVALGAEPAKAPPTVVAPSAHCVQQTGTLLPPSSKSCTASPGRVFTADELHRTGETTIAGALKRLDPSLH